VNSTCAKFYVTGRKFSTDEPEFSSKSSFFALFDVFWGDERLGQFGDRDTAPIFAIDKLQPPL
jgi:hypothetical protein